MPDFSLPVYDQPRAWIKKSRERGISWEEILLARKHDIAGLLSFLEDQVDMNFWPDLSVDDWKAIVNLQKSAEENAKKPANKSQVLLSRFF